ncbi:MAG: hypothetical protein LBW77_00325 [Verrucomicrobiota bacterium]|nr:hypothetical protein [Verrucomicrobiota bacterium]
MSTGLRVLCVSFVCAAYFVAGGAANVMPWHAVSDSGISAGDTGQETSTLTSGSRAFADDALMLSEQDNNPYLILLALRDAFAPCLFDGGGAGLPPLRVCRAAGRAPDVAPFHLRLFARSIRLLC